MGDNVKAHDFLMQDLSYEESCGEDDDDVVGGMVAVQMLSDWGEDDGKRLNQPLSSGLRGWLDDSSYVSRWGPRGDGA
jgi:hypothetical protein